VDDAAGLVVEQAGEPPRHRVGLDDNAGIW
jgi:hypothetical protein